MISKIWGIMSRITTKKEEGFFYDHFGMLYFLSNSLLESFSKKNGQICNRPGEEQPRKLGRNILNLPNWRNIKTS